MKPHHAIILAAGRGRRLGGLTAERPKCLVPVLGRSLLEWQREALAGGGVTEVAIVRGYQGHQLERPDVTLFDNPRWAESNMVRSLLTAATWLRTVPCLVCYSDLVYFDSTVRALMDTEGDIALTFDRNWRAQWEARFGDPLVDAETFAVDATGRVTDIGRKPTSLAEIGGQYMGLLKFTPSGWRDVENVLANLDSSVVDRLDMTGLLQRLIGDGIAVQGVPTTDPWFEVDSETDLAACNEAMRHLLRPNDRLRD